MEDRAHALRDMRICRFCLTEEEPLTNINGHECKNGIPLPLQIMACVAIEIFANDGMPQLICEECRLQTRKSYTFKTTCKNSDDALKLFLATGLLHKREKREVENLENTEMNKKTEIKKEEVQKRPLEEDANLPQTKRQKANESWEANNSEVEEDAATLARMRFTTPDGHTIEILDEDIDSIEIPEQLLARDECDELESNTEDCKSPPKQVVTQCFPCNRCERSFPLHQLLEIHSRQHTRERKYACYECDKRFFSKHDLTKHTQTHTGEKPFTCSVCHKSFSRANLLHRHEKIHVSSPKYLCTYCERTYLTSDDLDTHMVTHKKKRPFKCSKCDKSFAFKQGLERHEAVHNSQNPHQCNYCDESFTSSGKLARHVTSHAGNRPFPCRLCPRTFMLSHHLTRHLRNHYSRKSANNDDGEHKCDVCSMSFRRKDSLVNHTAIHSMVNLKCVICNKEFSDANIVRNHVTTHLAGLPYPCDKCDYSFETQEELEDHEVKHTDFDDDDDYSLEERLKNFEEAVIKEETPKVRRSLRESKIKNYAEFLKHELGYDSEENPDEVEDKLQPKSCKSPASTIQPVVRSETVKVYKGVKEKNSTNNVIVPTIEQKDAMPELTMKPAETAPKSLTKITTIENLGLSKSTLDEITDKSGFVEMKVGQKVIRVQKLMMSKADYQAMAKQGKLEIKGSSVVVPNSNAGLDLNKLTQINALTKNAAKDPLTEPPKLSEEKVVINPDLDIQLSKTPLRTYKKKTVRFKEPALETIVIEDEANGDIYTNNQIDLNYDSNTVNTSLVEPDMMNKF